MRRQTTKDEVKRILKAYQPHLTAKEIALKANVPYMVIYPILKRRGLQPKLVGGHNAPVFLTKEQKDKIKEIANYTLSAGQIAEKVNAKRAPVYAFMVRNDIQFKVDRNSRSKEKEVIGDGCFDWKEAKAIDTLFFAA